MRVPLARRLQTAIVLPSQERSSAQAVFPTPHLLGVCSWDVSHTLLVFEQKSRWKPIGCEGSRSVLRYKNNRYAELSTRVIFCSTR